MLTLNNQPIQAVSNITFLGMIFDKKLTWNDHTKNLLLHCQKGINLLKSLSKQNWGADTNTLLMLYRATIRAKMDYGVQAYGSANKALLKRLDSLHNTALRIILGAYRTSPVESLQCELGEPPLYLRRQYLNLTYATKLSANPHNPAYRNTFSTRFKSIFHQRKRLALPFYERINRHLTDLHIQLPKVFSVCNSSIPPWVIKIPTTNITLTKFNKSEYPHDAIRKYFYQTCSEYPNAYILYTDASKTHEGVGSAVVTPQEVYSYRLPPAASVYTGELYAVLQALLIINNAENSNNLIVTDSLSTVLSIQQLYPTNTLLTKIKTILYDLQEKNIAVRLIWVPSHVGIPGNEEADKHAKEAITKPAIPTLTEMLHTDVKCLLKQTIQKKWQEEWDKSSSKLKEIKTNVSKRNILPKNRRDQVLMARLRIGHTRLTHEYLLKKEQEPICDQCLTQISVKHILVECCKFDALRQKHNIGASTKDILSEPNNIATLKAYLTEAGLMKLL